MIQPYLHFCHLNLDLINLCASSRLWVFLLCLDNPKEKSLHNPHIEVHWGFVISQVWQWLSKMKHGTEPRVPGWLANGTQPVSLLFALPQSTGLISVLTTLHFFFFCLLPCQTEPEGISIITNHAYIVGNENSEVSSMTCKILSVALSIWNTSLQPKRGLD